MGTRVPVSEKLLKTSHEINNASPLEAGAVGFGAKGLITACLPYNKPKKSSLDENGCWIRKNGEFSLWIQGGPNGIPYGTYPRLFSIWLTTQAIRTGDRKIYAGGSIREFLRQVGVDSSRGEKGSGKRMLDQTIKFLEARAAFNRQSFNKQDISGIQGRSIQFAEDYQVLWNPKAPDQELLFDSYFVLSQAFYDEITSYSIPIDMRAVSALRSSPMALDIYQWLAQRLHYIKPGQRTMPSWRDLELQFGTEYRRHDHFIKHFTTKLRQVLEVYPQANVELNENGLGLILKNSPPPVPKKASFLTLLP